MNSEDCALFGHDWILARKGINIPTTYYGKEAMVLGVDEWKCTSCGILVYLKPGLGPPPDDHTTLDGVITIA